MEQKWVGGMKAIRKALVFAVLVGCAAVPSPEASFRDLTAPITSVALFDPAQFSGHWETIAAFDADSCGIGVVVASTGAINLSERRCSGDVIYSVAQITGPGRFTPDRGANKAREYWVMWVDQTYRTAVIGTVNGEFGMILNRTRDIPSDRMQAARKILDWNGYDLSRLIVRP